VITYDTPLVVSFEISGQKFMLLNGGPQFAVNPSISFFVVCESEEEVDSTWEKLIHGGEIMMPLDRYAWSQRYGWVQDKYGVNWQLSFGKLEEVGQKFTPVLMFTGNRNGKAEEAIQQYTSIFNDSEIVGILRYEHGENVIDGAIKHAQFKINGQVFMAMDSSHQHQFSFTEGISFVMECETQEEIDYYWEKLSTEGEENQCGWLKDKFGVSWQIVPAILSSLMADSSRAKRVLNAFLQMKKFDIEKLVNA
jgi:predicted 3-demethylubiquinone-9 3-methyltransferase (glyoxalase superfamily)